jgi:hypothetical protein
MYSFIMVSLELCCLFEYLKLAASRVVLKHIYLEKSRQASLKSIS